MDGRSCKSEKTYGKAGSTAIFYVAPSSSTSHMSPCSPPRDQTFARLKSIKALSSQAPHKVITMFQIGIRLEPVSAASSSNFPAVPTSP